MGWTRKTRVFSQRVAVSWRYSIIRCLGHRPVPNTYYNRIIYWHHRGFPAFPKLNIHICESVLVCAACPLRTSLKRWQTAGNGKYCQRLARQCSQWRTWMNWIWTGIYYTTHIYMHIYIHTYIHIIRAQVRVVFECVYKNTPNMYTMNYSKGKIVIPVRTQNAFCSVK